MFKRYIFLIFSVAAIAAFLGCHAGGHAPLINSFDSQIVERVATVTNGRFPDISFQSGAAIRCTTDNILKDGVKITAEEEKILVEYDYSTKAPVYYYLYKISAVLPSANALDGDVMVSTIEQPISITLPNNISDSGNCFVGLRASANEPWLYSLINDSVNANIAPLRLAKRADKTCSFNLFRLGQQFRLFVFDSFKENEAVVSSVTFFTDDKITIKDDKYAEDLNLKVRIIGEKLDQIKVDSLKARITYRNDNLSPVQLKANGSIVSQTDSGDKAVSGAYAHSFVVSNIKVESQMSGEAVLSLVLNLKDINLADFPTKFLIEFYSDGKAENTLPFIYTEAFSFETKEQQDDPPTPLETYTITLELNGGTLDETTIEYTAETEDFVLPTPTRTGYSFSGWTGYNGDTPEKTVTILKGSTDNRTYKANWQQNAPDEYTLTLVAGKGIASVDETKAYKAGESITLNCTLKEGYEFDKWVDSNENKVESPFIMLSEDVTLTATAKTITYSLNYFIDGGQLDNDNPKTYTVENEDITLCDPTKEGYEFLGWTSSEVTAPLTPMTIKQGTTGDQTFTANWSPKSYSITYNNIDGCTFETVNPSNYTVETEDITLCDPTKEGYTFLGWTSSETTVPLTPMSIKQGTTGDITFTANWSINSYRLDLVKGTGVDTVTGDGLHEYNSSVTATCTMLAGYEFDKWTGDLTTEVFNMPANNATMTANAKGITYNLTYNLDNGQLAVDNPANYTVETEDFTLNNPTKDGYTFKGWSGTDLEGDSNTAVTIPQGSMGERAYTANFVDEYKITYNLADGSLPEGSTNPATYSVICGNITLNNPSKDGYEFIGWIGSNGETPETSVTIEQGSVGNKEFTASYSLITYTITYNYDGGDLFYGNPTSFDITTPDFTLIKPSKDGKEFMGWTGTNLGNVLENYTVTIPKGSIGNRSYTAHWVTKNDPGSLEDPVIEYWHDNKATLDSLELPDWLKELLNDALAIHGWD